MKEYMNDRNTLIRDASPEDAQRLLDIYAYYVTDTAVSFEYEVPRTEEFADRIKRITQKYPYLVAEADGKAVGYAYAGPFIDRAAYCHSAELTIYLDRNIRRRGIGRKLYQALEERLRAMGILNLYACIGYIAKEDEYLTHDSPDFHAHMGFVKVGDFRKCGYKFGRWYDMIWMEKIIGEHEEEKNMDFLQLAKKRYSCKKYSDRPVESGKLEAVLEAGRLAPTAKNLQEQRIYVAQSAEALAKIDAATPCRYGAPVVLVVAYDRQQTYTYPGGGKDSGDEDAAIVATHMMLAAADLGLDSCWVNCFESDKLAKAMELPENEELLMLLDLGYAAEGAGPLENHGRRKPISETVTYI